MDNYDLAVIGAGPAGEVGAIRAAQLGMKVAIIEKREHLGGTCLNVGCIPTKSLLNSAKTWTQLNNAHKKGFDIGKPKYDWDTIMGRKDDVVNAQRRGLKYLMKKNKITEYNGHAKLISPTEIEVASAEIKAENILLATGSRVRELPLAPSGGNILNSDTILSIPEVPTSLAVIGGGVVGLEFASLFARFGCAVTVFEMLPNVLPGEDRETVDLLVRELGKQKIKFKTGVKLEKVQDLGHEVELTFGETERFDKVLSAIGREPVSDKLGLEEVGLHPAENGFITVDSHYRTGLSTVWAVGDLIATPALAHTASAEAVHAVETIAGKNPENIDYEANPAAIYTAPELASIGRNEEALKAESRPYKVAKFPFAPMAKAKIEDDTQGFVKILYEPDFHEILGVHIVGGKATELISELVMTKKLEGTVDELASAIHPHPTVAETIMEAAHIVHGSAIHL